MRAALLCTLLVGWPAPLPAHQRPTVATQVERVRRWRAAGRLAVADALCRRIVDRYERRQVVRSASELIGVAEALRWLGSEEEAARVLGEAIAADPSAAAAHRALGELLLATHRPEEARAEAGQALSLAPGAVDARLLLARAERAAGRPHAARLVVEKVLNEQPDHVAALALAGELALAREDLDGASEKVRRLAKLAPRDLGGRALGVAAAAMRGDRVPPDDQWLPLRARAELYRHAAEALLEARRYRDAEALLARALAADPDDATALALSGENLLRLGDEKRGLAELRRAYAMDRFDQALYPLLRLYDEVVPARYEMIDSPPFEIRVSHAARPEVERDVVPFLQRAQVELAARYGPLATGRLQIDLFEPDDFVARLGGGGELEAASFGALIIARRGAHERILWHELVHAFSSARAAGRVSYWLGEGLAESETRRRYPGLARRSVDAAAVGAPSLSDLAARFAEAESASELRVAYRLATEAVDFIASRWGFPKLLDTLDRLAHGGTATGALAYLIGRPIADLDEQYRRFLTERLQLQK